jgi:Family of unknown function (DUF5670)
MSLAATLDRLQLYTPCVRGKDFQLKAERGAMRTGVFLGIALVLLLFWVGGFLMFHVAGALIHLLLLFAVIAFVVHLFTGTKAGRP